VVLGALGAVAAWFELEVGGESVEVVLGALGAVAAWFELAVGGACVCTLPAMCAACRRQLRNALQLIPPRISMLTIRFIVTRPLPSHDER